MFMRRSIPCDHDDGCIARYKCQTDGKSLCCRCMAQHPLHHNIKLILHENEEHESHKVPTIKTFHIDLYSQLSFMILNHCLSQRHLTLVRQNLGPFAHSPRLQYGDPQIEHSHLLQFGNLQVLSIVECYMAPFLLESISTLIFRMQSLVTLSFRNSRFGYDTFTQKGFASLMKAISATFSLQSLDLSRTHFETLGMYTQSFPSMLNINASLTHVDISGNSFDPQRVLKWLHFQLPSLKSFVMQECVNKIKFNEGPVLVNLNSLLMVTNLEILNLNDFEVYRMFGGLHGNRSLRKLTLKNFPVLDSVSTLIQQELIEKCHLGFCLEFVDMRIDQPVSWLGILQSSLQLMNPLVEVIKFNL